MTNAQMTKTTRRNRLEMRLTHLLLAWAWLMLGKNACALADAPYTRFIEAEDMEAAPGGFRPNQNRGAGYSGDGWYALIYGHRDDMSKAVLSKTLERDLPPGRYRVLLRVYSEGAPESHQVEVLLNGGCAVFAYPTKETGTGPVWMEREISTERAGRQMTVRYLKMAQRIIFDTALITNERTWAIGQPSRYSLEHARDKTDTPAPKEDRANLIENANFEVGIGRGWRCGSQSGLALTGDMVRMNEGPEGAAALRVPLIQTPRLRSESGDRFQAILESPVCAVRPGKRYAGSIELRSESAATAYLAILFRGRTGEFRHAKGQNVELKPGEPWRRVQAEAESPAEASLAFLELSVTADQAGAFYAARAQFGAKDAAGAPTTTNAAGNPTAAWSC